MSGKRSRDTGGHNPDATGGRGEAACFRGNLGRTQDRKMIVFGGASFIVGALAFVIVFGYLAATFNHIGSGIDPVKGSQGEPGASSLTTR